jgi:hypothetical protein
MLFSCTYHILIYIQDNEIKKAGCQGVERLPAARGFGPSRFWGWRPYGEISVSVIEIEREIFLKNTRVPKFLIPTPLDKLGYWGNDFIS